MPNSKIIVTSGEKIKFSWQRNTKNIINVQTAYIEIWELQEKVSIDIKKGFIEIPLKEGTFTWRIVSELESDSLFNSEWHQLRVIFLRSPVQFRPSDLGKFYIKGDTSNIIFSWKNIPDTFKVEMELRNLKDNSIETLSAKSWEVIQKLLKTGQYRWKLRSQAEDGRLSEWSVPWDFEIIKEEKTKPKETFLKKPTKIILKKFNASNNLLSVDNKYKIDINLGWEKVSGIEYYKLIFYNDSKASNSVILKKTKYNMQALKHEDFPIKYQVIAYFKDNSTIASEKELIEFSVFPPKTIGPVGVMKPGKIVLVWNHMALQPNYDIQLSRDTNFKDVQSYKNIKNNFLSLDLKDQGKWHWRVRCTYGNKVSNWSNPDSFEIK